MRPYAQCYSSAQQAYHALQAAPQQAASLLCTGHRIRELSLFTSHKLLADTTPVVAWQVAAPVHLRGRQLLTWPGPCSLCT